MQSIARKPNLQPTSTNFTNRQPPTEATGYPVATLADGKGFFPEDHDQYIGG
jgi:hypothetical protein